MALPARSRIALRFRVAMRSLKTCSNRDLLRTSRLSRMFSRAYAFMIKIQLPTCGLGLAQLITGYKSENGIDEAGDEGDLIVELSFADLFEAFFAPPSGPLSLFDGTMALQMRADRFEGHATVAGDGFGGSPQLVRVEALMAELDDVDVVAPSGAGDAAFQDGDGLLGDGCLGRRRSFF